MSNFKGTPGPWVIGVSADNFIHCVDATGRDGRLLEVCEVWGSEDDKKEDSESRANAALIAKAPEMAELLNEISNWLVCGCIASPEDMTQSFEGFQQQIDALLIEGGWQ